MNNTSKDKILESRFDNDASQGYEFVHGAEAYFKNIKSPFDTVPKTNFLSEWGFISLEVFVAITLIVTAKLIDVNTDSTEFGFSSTKNEVNSTKSALTIEDNSFKIEPELNVIQSPNKSSLPKEVEPNSFSNSFISDSTANLFVMESNGEIKKVDSTNFTLEPQSFIYADYKSKYELRYIENLLVIDYSDTLFIGKKLEPILSGVPAPFENKDKIIDSNLLSSEKDLLIKRDNYLSDITKPLKLISNKKYNKALREFATLLKENPNDQNALFYSGIAYFNIGEYQHALANFELLKSMRFPLFEEDVDWLLVKIYAELGMKNASLILLKSIAKSNSFYRTQAITELKK